uniref:Zinc finger protein n=1 Tax=Steinernema glaseri TaxID=37863 RepID=A0A1I8AKL9_9BILA
MALLCTKYRDTEIQKKRRRKHASDTDGVQSVKSDEKSCTCFRGHGGSQLSQESNGPGKTVNTHMTAWSLALQIIYKSHTQPELHQDDGPIGTWKTHQRRLSSGCFVTTEPDQHHQVQRI